MTKRTKAKPKNQKWKWLVEEVQKRTGITRRGKPLGRSRIEEIIKLALHVAITEAAVRDEPFIIPGFFSVRVAMAAPRVSRRPTDGKPYSVPARPRVRVRTLKAANEWAETLVKSREGARR